MIGLAQQQFWFYEQLHPGTGQTVRLYHCSAALDVDRLQAAFDRVVALHDGLRAAFRDVAGRPERSVAPSCRVPLAVDTVADLAAVQALAAAEGSRGFDLGFPPLLRAVLVRSMAGEHLIVTAHHILIDEWALHLLMTELAAAYRGEAGSPGSDYRDEPATDAGDAEIIALTRPASLRHVAAGESSLGLLASAALPAAPRAAIGELARRIRSPELPVFAFLFATGLARAVGADRFTLGFIQSGRGDPARAGVLGPFAHVAPCEFEHRPHRGVLAALREHRAAYLDAIERPPRTIRAPSVLFTQALGLPATYAFGPGVALAAVPVARPVAPIDIAVELPAAAVWATTGELLVRHRPTALAAEHLACALGEVADLAVRSIAEPALRLDRVRPAPPAPTLVERLFAHAPAQPDALALGSAAAPPAPTLVERLFAHADAQPDALAVVHGDERLTYRELAARVGGFAAELAGRGIVRGEIVPIAAPRSIGWLIAHLGCFAAGGAAAPCDPRWPASHLASAIVRLGARMVAAPPGGAAETDLAGLGPTLVWPGPAAPAARRAPVPVHPHAACCVLATSGTTGAPRHVIITHGNLGALLAEPSGLAGAPPGPIAALANEAFDASLLEWTAAVWTGQPLVLVDRDVALDPPQFTALVRAHGVRTMVLTPAHLAIVLAAMPDALRDLTYLAVGGERLTTALAAALLRATQARVVDIYGPTECTIFCTSAAVTDLTEPRTIGRATRDAYVEVCDDDLVATPALIEGELTVGGPQVALGYFGQPRLTAERFMPCDRPGATGARRYRTGDHGYARNDGALVLVGRRDHQVKVRGHRVELGAIEHLASAIAGGATCVARLTAPGSIALYVVADLDPAALAALLRPQLPDYMQPAAIIPLAQLPLTARGKLDLAALPAPAAPAPVPRLAWSLAHRTLAPIVESALDVALASPHSDFFALGATSLSLMRVRHEIDELLGITLPWRDVFLHRTLDGVAQLIRARLGGDAADHLFGRAAAILGVT